LETVQDRRYNKSFGRLMWNRNCSIEW